MTEDQTRLRDFQSARDEALIKLGIGGHFPSQGLLDAFPKMEADLFAKLMYATDQEPASIEQLRTILERDSSFFELKANFKKLKVIYSTHFGV